MDAKQILESEDKSELIKHLRLCASEYSNNGKSKNNYCTILADILENNTTFPELKTDGIEDMFPIFCEELNNKPIDCPVIGIIQAYMYENAKYLTGQPLTRAIRGHFTKRFLPKYLPDFLTKKYSKKNLNNH